MHWKMKLKLLTDIFVETSVEILPTDLSIEKSIGNVYHINHVINDGLLI